MGKRKQDDRTYAYLLEKADLVYKFAMLYSDYISQKQDYGTDCLVNMVEVHTLTSIEENPGLTITQLAALWNRTRGAISQTATRLEKKGLIVRKKQEGNAKNVLLYVTEEGRLLSLAHKQHDIDNVSETLTHLRKTCTEQELEAFFKVVTRYIQLFEEDAL